MEIWASLLAGGGGAALRVPSLYLLPARLPHTSTHHSASRRSLLPGSRPAPPAAVHPSSIPSCLQANATPAGSPLFPQLPCPALHPHLPSPSSTLPALCATHAGGQ